VFHIFIELFCIAFYLLTCLVTKAWYLCFDRHSNGSVKSPSATDQDIPIEDNKEVFSSSANLDDREHVRTNGENCENCSEDNNELVNFFHSILTGRQPCHLPACFSVELYSVLIQKCVGASHYQSHNNTVGLEYITYRLHVYNRFLTSCNRFKKCYLFKLHRVHEMQTVTYIHKKFLKWPK